MTLALRWSIVAFALILAACSSNDTKEKPAALVDFDATAKLKKNWSVNAGSGQRKHHYTRFIPAIDNNVIFVSDAKGSVFAYDVQTGKRKWKTRTDYEISGSIAAANGNVFFGTYNAEVVALDAQTGEEKWQSPVSGEVLAAPVANNRLVIVQTTDSKLFALDVITGVERWKYDHIAPVLTLRSTASPIIVASQVVAAFDNGQVVSLGVNDGSTQWKSRVAQPKGRTDLDKIVDADSFPVSHGALIFAASYHGNVIALNRGNGSPVWKRPASTFNNLDVDDNAVYLSLEDSIIHARDPFNGQVKWTNDQLRLRGTGSPIVMGDYVAVIDSKGYLHLLTKADGSFAYRFKPKGSGFRSPMITHDDQLIILSDDGNLTSYSLN